MGSKKYFLQFLVQKRTRHARQIGQNSADGNLGTVDTVVSAYGGYRGRSDAVQLLVYEQLYLPLRPTQSLRIPGGASSMYTHL